MESTLLDWVRFYPRVEVFIAVVAYFESGSPCSWITEHLV